MTEIALHPALALQSEPLAALISPFGAELLSFTHEKTEWLWQGSAATWPRRAPILFPFCGRVHRQTIWVDGVAYPNQPIHGFAPNSPFTLLDHGRDYVQLRLTDTAQTRALYPFGFELTVEFRLNETELLQSLTCHNPNETTLPFSAGFHPGFIWPLPGATHQADHHIIFEADETESVALPDDNGLMGGERLACPTQGRHLKLNDRLFRAGSVIFDRLKSRSLWFGVPGQPGLRIEFDTPTLVLWRWPGPEGATYLCIEPWAGLPDPQGFCGEFANKPGITLIPPGKNHSWTIRMQPNA